MADVVSSEELRSFLLRLYSVCEALEFDALRKMFSTGRHVLVIGTDPNEWWTGSDGLDLWIIQTRELGGFRIEPGSSRVRRPLRANPGREKPPPNHRFITDQPESYPGKHHFGRSPWVMTIAPTAPRRPRAWP